MNSFSHSHNIKCCFHSKNEYLPQYFCFPIQTSKNYSYMKIHLLEMQNEDMKFSFLRHLTKLNLYLKQEKKIYQLVSSLN